MTIHLKLRKSCFLPATYMSPNLYVLKLSFGQQIENFFFMFITLPPNAFIQNTFFGGARHRYFIFLPPVISFAPWCSGSAIIWNEVMARTEQNSCFRDLFSLCIKPLLRELRVPFMASQEITYRKCAPRRGLIIEMALATMLCSCSSYSEMNLAVLKMTCFSILLRECVCTFEIL